MMQKNHLRGGFFVSDVRANSKYFSVYFPISTKCLHELLQPEKEPTADERYVRSVRTVLRGFIAAGHSDLRPRAEKFSFHSGAVARQMRTKRKVGFK
jgi:hypothetical protein